MIGCSTPPVGAVATACPDAGVQPLPPASVCPACDENALCVGGICACNTGYAGDGEVCSAVPRGMPRETVLPSDFSEAIREVTLSADGNVIAMAGSRTAVVHRARDGWGPPQSIGRTDFAVLESSMALSADGSVLAATRNVAVATCNAADSGIAIYVRRGDLYGIEAVISPPENQATLAEPIALSADGNTLAAVSFDRNLGEARAVLYARTERGWEAQSLPNQTPRSPSSLALSANGNRVAIPGRDNGAFTQVFTRVGSTWTEDAFVGGLLEGQDVALNADGNVLVIGNKWDRGTGLGVNGLEGEDDDNPGAAYVLERREDGWVRVVFFKAPADHQESFGGHVALSADGQRVVVVALGAIHTYRRDASGWHLEGPTLANGRPPGLFDTDALGWTLAMSSDGNVLVASAPFGAGMYLYEWSPR